MAFFDGKVICGPLFSVANLCHILVNASMFSLMKISFWPQINESWQHCLDSMWDADIEPFPCSLTHFVYKCYHTYYDFLDSTTISHFHATLRFDLYQTFAHNCRYKCKGWKSPRTALQSLQNFISSFDLMLHFPVLPTYVSTHLKIPKMNNWVKIKNAL